MFVNHSAIAAAAAQKRIVCALREQGATSSSSAVGLRELKNMDRRQLASLEKRGIVHTSAGASWLDEGALAESNARQVRIVAIVLGVLTALVLYLVFAQGRGPTP